MLTGLDSHQLCCRQEPLPFDTEEYAFTGPENIAAGWQTVQLMNRGRDVHSDPILEAATWQSNRCDPDPGRKNTKLTTVARASGRRQQCSSWSYRHCSDLFEAPGEYVLLCGIPDAVGRPHAMHGMVRRASQSAWCSR